MIIIFGILCLILLLTLKVHWKGLDEQYLSKDYTQVIKGIFVVIVFLSHVRTYVDFPYSGDQMVIKVLNYLGQLMVALFLFYSGYGIYESIKRKGLKYIQHIPSNRVGKTLFDFAFALSLFYILALYIGKKYSLSHVLLSLTGWTSIGNSNWYMFTIFTLYILTYISFRFTHSKRLLSLCLFTILSLGYVYILSQIQPSRFSNTALCYTGGMWYSYFKKDIDSLFHQHQILYYISTFLILFSYFYCYPFKGVRIMYFNGVSLLFCMVFVLLSMKISFKSQVLKWFGDYLFWVYILQRIPMIFFAHIGLTAYHPYIYLFITLIITLLLSQYIQILTAKLKNLIWK